MFKYNISWNVALSYSVALSQHKKDKVSWEGAEGAYREGCLIMNLKESGSAAPMEGCAHLPLGLESPVFPLPYPNLLPLQIM